MKTLGTAVGETTGNGKDPEQETGEKKEKKRKRRAHLSRCTHTHTQNTKNTTKSTIKLQSNQGFFVLFCVFNQKVMDEWIKLKKAIIKHLIPRSKFFDYMTTEAV